MTAYLRNTNLNEIGFRERCVGTVTILDPGAQLSVKLRFGGSSVTLARAVRSLIAVGRRQILLDFHLPNSISAKSLGELVSTYVEITDGGGELKAFNVTPTVEKLMKVTKLSAVFAPFQNEEYPVDSFSFSDGTTRERNISAIPLGAE